ncbi:MAG: hypothetical protein PHQ34_14350, partial [Methanothrix sp.]|nr:hypothetical protein [Methanothrix sp.]
MNNDMISMISEIVWRYDVNARGELLGSSISPIADRLLGLPSGSLGDSIEKFISYIYPDDLPAAERMMR